MSESREDRERWDLALEAIDDALEEEEDLQANLMGALCWALLDIADSFDVIAQHVEHKEAKPSRRGRGGEVKLGKKGKKPRRGADEEE